MITERTLRKWRKEALKSKQFLYNMDGGGEFTEDRREYCDRILRLTQELLDQHLLRK